MTTTPNTTPEDVAAAGYALGLLAELVSGSRDKVALDINPAKDEAARKAVRPLLETWVMPALAAIVTNRADLRADVAQSIHHDTFRAACDWVEKALPVEDPLMIPVADLIRIGDEHLAKLNTDD